LDEARKTYVRGIALWLTASAMNTLSDTCLRCETSNARKVVRDRTINVGAYSVTIPSVPHVECVSCGESYQTGQQAKALDTAVINARRRHGRLLSGRDI
jgi:YgiT-type zinc finger domain-containing protein